MWNNSSWIPIDLGKAGPVGERLAAVCDLSEAAYSFAAGFRNKLASGREQDRLDVKLLRSAGKAAEGKSH